MKRPVVYIGANEDNIACFNRLLEYPVRVVSDVDTALRAVGREHYLIFFYEKNDPGKDIPEIGKLRAKYKSAYIVLISPELTSEERKVYLRAGIYNAVSAEIDSVKLNSMLRLLEDNRLAGKSGGSKVDAKFRMPLGKRLFDIAASGVALLLLSPLLLAVAAVIRLESKGPVIYKSKRVGSNYRVFDFLKFRSMYINADQKIKEMKNLNQYTSDDPAKPETKPTAEPTFTGIDMPDEADGVMLISDDFVISEEEYASQVATEQKNAFVKFENDPRITRMGRFIRKYSIDELPQLINILKGDMSVVGNRPLPLYEAELLTSDEYVDRFMCPAGLTGLWQVEKRGEGGKLSPEERKQLDIKYAKSLSPWLDLQIILKTCTAFIQKENV